MPKLKSRSGGLDTGGNKRRRIMSIFFILFFLRKAVAYFLSFFCSFGTFLNCQEKRGRRSFVNLQAVGCCYLLLGHHEEGGSVNRDKCSWTSWKWRTSRWRICGTQHDTTRLDMYTGTKMKKNRIDGRTGRATRRSSFPMVFCVLSAHKSTDQKTTNSTRPPNDHSSAVLQQFAF